MNVWIFFISFCVIFGSAKTMPGGWNPVTNLTSPSMLENGRQATALVSNSMDSPLHMKMMNITKAEKQVVSGMNYRLEIRIGPSECKKSTNYTSEEIENCPLLKCEKPYLCNILLWVQPWREEKYKLTSFNCTEEKSLC